jgi:hypothetical protein
LSQDYRKKNLEETRMSSKEDKQKAEHTKLRRFFYFHSFYAYPTPPPTKKKTFFVAFTFSFPCFYRLTFYTLYLPIPLIFI